MSIKTIRRMIWNPKRNRQPVYEQLELRLPASRLNRHDVELLDEIRRLRENLSRS